MQSKEKWITVEMGGTKKTILKSKLPELREMAKHMYNLALKAGHPEKQAEEMYTLRIVKDE